MKPTPERKAYEAGFRRALMLALGTGATWTAADKLLRNKLTRKLFGRKRRGLKYRNVDDQ